jgi:hypothetical protein
VELTLLKHSEYSEVRTDLSSSYKLLSNIYWLSHIGLIFERSFQYKVPLFQDVHRTRSVSSIFSCHSGKQMLNDIRLTQPSDITSG